LPGPGRATAMVRVEKVTRFLRYILYLSIIGMLWWLFSTFAFVALDPGDGSIREASGYRRVLVKKYDDQDWGAEHGDLLVFAALNARDEQYFRISRVVAKPGDLVMNRAGYYTINGELTEIHCSKVKSLEGRVPEGFYILVNDDPESPYPDSLRLGLIDKRWVIGRFLSELPF